MTVRGEKIWAIGFGGQVELRSCKKAPRPVVTNFEKETEVVFTNYEIMPNGRLQAHRTKVPRKISINNTIHTGGRVLGSVSLDRFWTCTRKVLPRGQALQLTKTQAAKLLGANPHA